MIKISLSFLLLLAFILVLHVFTIYFSYQFNFINTVSFSYVFLYALDSLLMVMVLSLIFFKFRSRFIYFKKNLDFDGYLYSIRIFILIAFVFLAYKAFGSILAIISGARREDLVLGEGAVTGIDTAIFSFFIVLIFTFYVYFGKRLYVALLLFLGVVLSMSIGASRSELISIALLFIILCGFFGFWEKKWTLILGSIVILSASVMATIFLQNRPIAEGFSGFYYVVETFFRYRAYSLFLAEHAIAAADSFEKILYPFFGYLIERPLAYLSPTVPIDSSFVTQYHYLGDYKPNHPMLANVLYPWWAWFYGAFGVVGLVLKALFSYLVFFFLLKNRLFFSFFIFVLLFVVSGAIKHPFLTLDGVVSVFVCIFFDIGYRRFKIG